jgi:hypothetical protein
MLPSSDKEAPNLVDSLQFPDIGYKRMGKVQKGRLCQSAKICAHRSLCGFNKVPACFFKVVGNFHALAILPVKYFTAQIYIG